MKGFKDPKDILSIEDLEAEFEKVFLIKDKGIIRILMSIIITNQLSFGKTWLMIIGPPSGGKTAILMTLAKLKFIHPIADLTVNTLLSGYQNASKESSLLMQMNGGIMTFYDFTSILEKNKDAKKEIMKQLRQVYDGDVVKHTGLGKPLRWQGRIDAIGGCTESIYRLMKETAIMGERFIYYNLEQPNRDELFERASKNMQDEEKKTEHLQLCVKNFVEYVIDYIEEKDLDIELHNKDIRKKLWKAADFATRARSAVETDFKTQALENVPEPEMPTRVYKQLCTIAAGFIAMELAKPGNINLPNKKEISIQDKDIDILCKTALNSIPRSRLRPLRYLTRYRGGVRTATLATQLNLPTIAVARQLHYLDGLLLCQRKKMSGPLGDLWVMPENFRKMYLNVEHVNVVDQIMGGDEEESVFKGAQESLDASDPTFGDYNQKKDEIDDILG